jgi:rRNA maturation endonuclease Nob1
MYDGIDPYTPAEPLYECLGCGERSVGGNGGSCGDCGGTLKNIAVSRE